MQVEGAAVGDAGGEPVLLAGRARGEVRAEARPDQRDACRVNLRAVERVIEDGPNDILPVRPERESLLDQSAALAGAVKGERVVAARERRGSVGEVELLDGAISWVTSLRLPPVSATQVGFISGGPRGAFEVSALCAILRSVVSCAGALLVVGWSCTEYGALLG